MHHVQRDQMDVHMWYLELYESRITACIRSRATQVNVSREDRMFPENDNECLQWISPSSASI